MVKQVCDRRPKKFLGAIIGAAAGIAGGIMNKIDAAKAAKVAARKQRYDAALEGAASLNKAYANDGEYSTSVNDKYSLEFANGGYVPAKSPGKTRSLYEVINSVSNSGTNFANRLNEKKLRTIPIENGKVGSHKMSYGNDEQGYYVYPEIQETGGKLKDLSVNRKAAHNSARKNGDYVRVNDENEARLFSEHYKEYYPSFKQFDSKFANGGQIAIKAGGVAQPVGGGMSLLRGRKHSSGGIDIDVANKKIEAEAGEVLQRTNDGLRIFSAKSLPGVGVPAQEVLANPSASSEIFAKQELYKQVNGLTDSGKKKVFGDYLGIPRKFDNSSEEAFTKDTNSFLAKKATGQRVGSATATAVNVAAPIISGLISRSAANKIKDPVRPTLYRAASLKTDYNINPQLSEIDKNARRYGEEVDNNTISSVAALSRKQRLSVDTIGQKNNLFGQKENIETELKNTDAMNRQQVDAQNTASLNAYNDRLADTENTRTSLKINATNTMLSGVAAAGRDYQARMDAAKEKDDTLKAIVAGDSTNSTAVLMKKGAFDGNMEVLAKFMNSSDPEIAAEARRRMGYKGKRSYKPVVLNPPVRPVNTLSNVIKPSWNKI